jgi:hypothetical protein
LAPRASQLQMQPKTVKPNAKTFTKADKRIPRNALATFDALQQKARLKWSELQKSRHGRI